MVQVALSTYRFSRQIASDGDYGGKLRVPALPATRAQLPDLVLGVFRTYLGLGWWAVPFVVVLAVWGLASWLVKAVAAQARQPVVVALVLWLLYRRAEERRGAWW